MGDEKHIGVRVAQVCLYTERKQPTQGETEDAVVGQQREIIISKISLKGKKEKLKAYQWNKVTSLFPLDRRKIEYGGRNGENLRQR